jgi:hypothetical protein
MGGALVIGDVTNEEFSDALAALGEAFEVTTCADVAGAIAINPSTDASRYELIVLAQSRPGEVTQADCDQLRRCFPVAAMISLAGSWCEGEMRSGKPPATGCRIYWHQAAHRLRQDIARHAAGHTPTWSLPTTSTEDERVLARSRAPKRKQQYLNGGEARAADRQQQRGPVALFGHERTSVEFLVDACRAGGFESHWIGTGRTIEPGRAVEPGTVQAAIWDVTILGDMSSEIAEITHIVPAERIVALLGFPRWHDLQRAAHLGLGAVVSKPFVLDDLYSALDNLFRVLDDSSNPRRHNAAAHVSEIL